MIVHTRTPVAVLAALGIAAAPACVAFIRTDAASERPAPPALGRARDAMSALARDARPRPDDASPARARARARAGPVPLDTEPGVTAVTHDL